MRPRRAAPAEAARVTRAEINLAHVRHNLHELRACTAPSGAKIWAVLKADAYGHGAAATAMTLAQAGVDGICVALLEEGIELRNAGVRCPILVMSGSSGRRRDGLEALIEHRLTPVIFDLGQIEGLAQAHRYVASLTGEREPLVVHLKVDTGMGRLGLCESELDRAVAGLRNAPELVVEGLMTHLACADGRGRAETDEQLRRFELASRRLAQAGIAPSVRHAANSAAMLRWPESHLDLVRPGIALFGVHPCPAAEPHGASDVANGAAALDGPGTNGPATNGRATNGRATNGSAANGRATNGSANGSRRSAKLKPAMRILSEVVALRELPTGASLGYGHTWTAPRPSRIATVPIGYADGLSRILSNRGSMLIGGRRAPIVGTVSMDLTMVDVSDIDGVSLCDEVVVLGPQSGRHGSDCIEAAELADLSGTVTWECLTSISRRVPRFYRYP